MNSTNAGTPEDYQLAATLLAEGRTTDEVRQTLVEQQHLTGEEAATVTHEILLHLISEQARNRLANGEPAGDVEQSLRERGFDAEAATAIVAHAQQHLTTNSEASSRSNGAALLGGVVTVAGALLLIGNISGFFPTFPYAGFLTMLAGGAISSLGGNRT